MIFIILMAIFMLWVFFNNDDGIRKKYKNGWYNCKHFDECSFKKDVVYGLILSAIITTFISGLFTLCVVCLPFFPTYDYSYKFNINSIKDNLVTEGHVYYRRGYINEELSYFFSRTMDYWACTS